MLLEISIKNFAIIEEISLNFEKGMTVLTGETGAGKYHHYRCHEHDAGKPCNDGRHSTTEPQKQKSKVSSPLRAIAT